MTVVVFIVPLSAVEPSVAIVTMYTERVLVSDIFFGVGADTFAYV